MWYKYGVVIIWLINSEIQIFFQISFLSTSVSRVKEPKKKKNGSNSSTCFNIQNSKYQLSFNHRTYTSFLIMCIGSDPCTNLNYYRLLSNFHLHHFSTNCLKSIKSFFDSCFGLIKFCNQNSACCCEKAKVVSL